jgi:hypothetical protein
MLQQNKAPRSETPGENATANTQHSTNGGGCLPAKFHVTLFKDGYAKSLDTKEMSLDELRDMVVSTTAPAKGELPFLKLAKFGDKRTKKGCLRNNKNVTEISGTEVDYDLKKISFDDAVDTIRRARLAALLYTSANYSVTAPKWRVILPTSAPLAKTERARLVARVNGLFGGTLSGESFTLSQSFYFGSINSNPEHRAVIVDGDFIDQRGDLDAGAVWKAKAKGNGKADDEGNTRADWQELVGNIHNGVELHKSTLLLAAKLVASGMQDGAAINLVRAALEVAPLEHDERWHERYEDIPRLVKSEREKLTELPVKPWWRDIRHNHPAPTLANAVIAIKALGISCRLNLFHHIVLVDYQGTVVELKNRRRAFRPHRRGYPLAHQQHLYPGCRRNTHARGRPGDSACACLRPGARLSHRVPRQMGWSPTHRHMAHGLLRGRRYAIHPRRGSQAPGRFGPTRAAARL